MLSREEFFVSGVEMFKKLLDRGEAGDNIGCLLRGVKRDEISRGQVSRIFSEKKTASGAMIVPTPSFHRRAVWHPRALTLTIANS